MVISPWHFVELVMLKRPLSKQGSERLFVLLCLQLLKGDKFLNRDNQLSFDSEGIIVIHLIKGNVEHMVVFNGGQVLINGGLEMYPFTVLY